MEEKVQLGNVLCSKERMMARVIALATYMPEEFERFGNEVTNRQGSILTEDQKATLKFVWKELKTEDLNFKILAEEGYEADETQIM